MHCKGITRDINELYKGEALSWGIYHYSGKPAVTWYDFAGVIFQQITKIDKPKLIGCTSAEFITKASRPMNSVMSSNLIRKEMGFNECNWKKELLKYYEL